MHSDIQNNAESLQMHRLSFPAFLAFVSLLLLIASNAQSSAGSLTLAQALAIAREHNHDFKLSRFAAAGARANVEIADAAPNPTLTMQSSSFHPGSGLGGGPLWKKSIDTTLRIDQLIERGGKRELRTENASKLAQAAQADSSDTLRQLEVLVSQAYADLLAAQDRRKAAQDAAQLFDAMLVVAKKRKNAGDIAGVDVERVKVDALRANNEIDATEGELSRARHALALLLGQASSPGQLEAIDPWPSLQNTDIAIPEQNLQQIVAQRADVLAAAARVDAAKAGSQYAQALRTRNVTLGLQYEHYPQPGGNQSGSANSYGIAIQIPLFVRHYYKGEILSAESALDAANENLEKTREAAAIEIQSAANAVTSTAARVRRNRDELLVAAAKAAKAAEFAYQNGAAGVIDVLDARRTLRATRLDALTALLEYSKALAVWRAATTTENTAALQPQQAQ